MRINLEFYRNIRDEKGYLILPEEFENKDGKFKQISRVGNAALYQRGFGYEVILVQECNPFEITPGVFTEKKQGWPNNNSWGNNGWSFMDLKSAEKKFNYLINKKEEPPVQSINSEGETIIKKKRGRPRKYPLT